MIRRVWRGWTRAEEADAYARLLQAEVVPGIEAKRLPGYRGIEVLRRQVGPEVEFTTIMSFDQATDVLAFRGADVTSAYVPERARELLVRWEPHATHHEVAWVKSSA